MQSASGIISNASDSSIRKTPAQQYFLLRLGSNEFFVGYCPSGFSPLFSSEFSRAEKFNDLIGATATAEMIWLDGIACAVLELFRLLPEPPSSAQRAA